MRSGKTELFRGKGKNESVVFVPATTRSELKSRYMKVIAEAGVMLTVAEVPEEEAKEIRPFQGEEM